MPGIVPRSATPSNNGSGAIKVRGETKSEGVTGENIDEAKMQDHSNGNTYTNGVNGLVNGTYINGTFPTPTETQCKTSTAIKNIVGHLPPEIEHITFGYVPFSTLIARLVQETFNGLTDVINDMEELPVPQPGLNGALSLLNRHNNGNGATGDANVQKKLRILNFASDRRAQFIKILILSKWARQAEAVSKTIDLNVWASNRRQEYQGCVSWVGELKRRLGPLRDPNPDIKTALEVLSLGKASWLSDLGYLPPEPLSAQQLLSTLRKINVLLSIRMNLYEKIPSVFRNFSIASGRVTFKVAEEFEVDLSIAEEDPASQLYFIDFRYLFSPTPKEISVGRLRDEVERGANRVLQSEGLQGLFSFLHNLVLTHKLAVLKNQAYGMAKGYWSDHLQVEPVHRSVVVQYWLNKPGLKNWIEIGLKRGKGPSNPFSLNVMCIPHIAIRWFRDGKEVDKFQVSMSLDELSLADILKQIIALHTSYIFRSVAKKLGEAILYSEGYMRLKRNPATADPLDAFLLVQITSSKAVKVVQEPVSGRFAVLPASQLNSRVEFELNRLVSPASDGAAQFMHLRSFAMLEEVDRSARSIAWEPVRSLNPDKESIQQLFSMSVQKMRFFKRPSWSGDWLLAFTTSPEGDFWWIVDVSGKETARPPRSSNHPAGISMQAAYKILLPGQASLVVDTSVTSLAQIEQTAAGMISQNIDTGHLSNLNIQHKIQVSTPNSVGSQPPSIAMFIHLPTERGASLKSFPQKSDLAWAHDIVKLEYRGLDPSRTLAVHIASVRVSKTISNVKDVISAIRSVAFRPSTQTLAFHFITKVGETTIPQLTSRLSAIGRLLNFISTIKLHKIKFKALSLTRIHLTYARAPSILNALIHFAAEAPMYISLMPPNPHLRIIDHLTTLLRSKDLTTVLATMRMTVPLLDALSAIEANGGVIILPRSEQWFQVRYSEPYAKGGYDIRLRHRRGEVMWFIADSSVRKAETDKVDAEQNLETIMRGKGEGWWGVRGGMIAHYKGVENLLTKLDDIFRTSKHVAGESNHRKRKAEDEIVEID